MDLRHADVTRLLAQWRSGDATAESELMNAVYPVLKQIASKRMSANDKAVLSATDLVHASYERLVDQRDVAFANRAHFFAISARVIRRVLVDHVRERSAEKRGGLWTRVSLSQADATDKEDPIDSRDLLVLDRAIGELEQVQPRAAQVIEMRYFSGMTLDEVAMVLGRSLATIKRDWRFAMAFLNDHLSDRGPL
jgi:RNA polymerase sigma factor (TIGR02999 family)